jgi:hypothetical protein
MIYSRRWKMAFDLAKLGLRKHSDVVKAAQPKAEKESTDVGSAGVGSPASPDQDGGGSSDSGDAVAGVAHGDEAQEAEEVAPATAPTTPATQLGLNSLAGLMRGRTQPKPAGTDLAMRAATEVSTLEPTAPQDEVYAVGPEGFQARLDALDAVVSREAMLSDFSASFAKNRIKDIFLELRKFPEYDGLIVDRDVHNIMSYMQYTITFAQEKYAEKKTAKVKRESKAAAKPKYSFNFDKLMAPASDLALSPAKATSISSLAAMDTDAIESKGRR